MRGCDVSAMYLGYIYVTDIEIMIAARLTR